MPPKAKVPDAPPAPAAPAPPEFVALSEEETSFVWLSLVEQGQFTAAKLQQFMMDVCGEKLSTMQARDLLNYMDANGDGIVGREDFRNFMSVGRMEDTNPKDFMWTPKRTYREEHGTAPSKDEAGPSSIPATRGSIVGDSISFPDRRRSVSSAEGSLAGGAVSSTAPPLPGQEHAVPPLPSGDSKAEPRPPPGKRRGPTGGRAARAAAAAAEQAEAAAVMAPPSSSDRPEHAAGGKSKAPAPQKPDQKMLLRIDEALEKYEAESWQRFLRLEQECKDKLFAQYASAEGMTAMDYHKMLLRWQKLARKSMPADIRPADSLAAMRDIIQRDRIAQDGPSASASDPASPTAAGDAEGDEDALASDAKLTFRIWQDVINGKHRPSHSSAEKK